MGYEAKILLTNGEEILTRQAFTWIDDQREKNAFKVDALVMGSGGQITTARVLVRWAAIATVTEMRGYRS